MTQHTHTQRAENYVVLEEDVLQRRHRFAITAVSVAATTGHIL